MRPLRLTLAVLFTVAASSAAAQTAPNLLGLDRTAVATAAQRSRLAVVSRNAAAVALARPDVAALAAATRDQTIRLDLAPGLSVQASITDARTLATGRRLVAGRIAGEGRRRGTVTLVVDRQDVAGSIALPDGTPYRLRALGGGLHAVMRLDPAKLPPDEPPGVMEALGVTAAPPTTADGPIGNDGSTIDLLVGYSPAALAAHPDMAQLIDLAVAETNQALANSGAVATVNLVGTMQAPYAESNQNASTILQQVPALLGARRDQLNADIAVLLTQTVPDACGIAATIGATPANPYALVSVACMTDNLSLPHELGHLMGARHDIATDPGQVPFAFGHGYRTNVGWRTIMAYPCPDGTCPNRIPHVSTPAVNYQGRPLGNAEQADVARVWTLRAPVVAGFMAHLPIMAGPGRLGFVKTANTGSGSTEVHIVSGSSAYQTFTVQTGTAFGIEPGGTWQLLDSGDLAFIKTQAPGSGRVEVHIVSQATGYRTFTRHSVSAFMPETDGQWQLLANGDLGFIKTGPTPNGHVEVHIVSAASNYMQFVLQTPTTFATETDGTWQFLANRDLAFVKTANTGTNTVEVHIASAVSNYQTRTLDTGTTFALETDGRWQLLANNDLAFIKTANTTYGQVEVHIASAGSNYRTRTVETVTAFADENDGTWQLLP